MEPNIPVVDTHVHFWDIDHLHYEWLKEAPLIHKTLVPEDYVEEIGAANIHKIVFVEGGVATDDAMARQEVNWVNIIAEQETRIQGIVAHASLENGEEARPHLEWLNQQPLVKGVRRLLQGEEDPEFCLQQGFLEGINLLKEYRFSFDICIRHHQLPAVIKLVEQCPGVQFILDHIGKPNIKEKQQDPWRDHIHMLAQLPNIVCKISGAFTEADTKHWQPEDVRPYIEHVIDAFGTDRIMFGSDWPVVRLAANYNEWLNLVKEITKDFSHLEKSKFFQENADIIYRLPPMRVY
jgi:L-fuconolactonase